MARSYAVDLNHKNELFFITSKKDMITYAWIKIAQMFRKRMTQIFLFLLTNCVK